MGEGKIMQKDLNWFEFKDVIRKPVKNDVWIPLWWIQSVKSAGSGHDIGDYEDFVFLNTVIAPPESKDELFKFECSDLNPVNGNDSKRWENIYIRADTVYDDGYEPLGEYAVLYHEFGRKAPCRHYLNHDLVFALDLIEQGDNWVRPAEGFDVVVRQHRDEKGELFKVDIKAKYLKDYLCAKGCGLFVCAFYERSSIFAERPDFGWPKGEEANKKVSKGCKWAGYMQPMDATGKVFPGKIHVSTFGYKEIHAEDDVPKFDPRDSENEMYAESKEIGDLPVSRYRVVSELRRFEWVDPGKKSVRAGDDEEASLEFYSESDGSLKGRDELEYPPQWLWFRNDVINRVLTYQGASFKWHTADTGTVQINSDWPLHFGVNKLGLINVFAKDIVGLPLWQQEIWKGYNVAPEGGVSEELLMSQMKCQPARTNPVEIDFLSTHDHLRQAFNWISGGKELFEHLPPTMEMHNRIHRFSVQNEDDLFLLAKEICKVTIDAFNIGALRSMLPKTEDIKKLRSRNLFGKFLAQYAGEDVARTAMSPLAYIYDLRCADAHIKSSEVQETMHHLHIDASQPLVEQAKMLIMMTYVSLARSIIIFQNEYRRREKEKSGSVEGCE